MIVDISQHQCRSEYVNPECSRITLWDSLPDTTEIRVSNSRSATDVTTVTLKQLRALLRVFHGVLL